MLRKKNCSKAGAAIKVSLVNLSKKKIKARTQKQTLVCLFNQMPGGNLRQNLINI